jgi:hypothetical protein
MIIVKLIGGLGNQMFQYAAGKALAVKNSTELFCDHSFLMEDPGESYTRRLPELGQLNVSCPEAPADLTDKFFNETFFAKLFYRKKDRYEIFNEHGPRFDPEFFSLGKNAYLNGFWQSEKYFHSIREVLLKEFTPAYEFSDSQKKILAQINATNSVSIHVRRGDYIHLPGAHEFHGVCSLSYYKEAIRLIREKNNNAEFFVFSDDMDWCKDNFGDISPLTFVEGNSKFSSTDLLLMSNCRHNIIANSSYSWWGAWLNRHEDKSVIAPVNWYQKSGIDTSDLYCKGWIRI